MRNHKTLNTLNNAYAEVVYMHTSTFPLPSTNAHMYACMRAHAHTHARTHTNSIFNNSWFSIAAENYYEYYYNGSIATSLRVPYSNQAFVRDNASITEYHI